jgi:hypothetical protein
VNSPHGATEYVRATLEFANWAFMTEEDHDNATTARHAVIATLAATERMHTLCEYSLSQSVPASVSKRLILPVLSNVECPSALTAGISKQGSNQPLSPPQSVSRAMASLVDTPSRPTQQMPLASQPVSRVAMSTRASFDGSGDATGWSLSHAVTHPQSSNAPQGHSTSMCQGTEREEERLVGLASHSSAAFIDENTGTLRDSGSWSVVRSSGSCSASLSSYHASSTHVLQSAQNSACQAARSLCWPGAGGGPSECVRLQGCIGLQGGSPGVHSQKHRTAKQTTNKAMHDGTLGFGELQARQYSQDSSAVEPDQPQSSSQNPHAWHGGTVYAQEPFLSGTQPLWSCTAEAGAKRVQPKSRGAEEGSGQHGSRDTAYRTPILHNHGVPLMRPGPAGDPETVLLGSSSCHVDCGLPSEGCRQATDGSNASSGAPDSLCEMQHTCFLECYVRMSGGCYTPGLDPPWRKLVSRIVVM